MNGNVLAAGMMIGVLVLMVIPVPTGVVDVLLTFNIAFAMTVFLVTVYLKRPMDFSVFPSLLLMVTLFRLALNVASTRLILSNADAGAVIAAFGDFVVGGNFVIGVVVFLILVLVQFVVITKGSGRIAEVSARFTLDALPGKQMAIDADLNAGMITEHDARTRRKEIADEAEFYGAMDGASKFVRGDAIAGMVITAINILGGLAIGTLQRGMPVGDSARIYTLLTVGDGLVSQIPALLVSTAAGIVVTRNNSGLNLGTDIATQVVQDPRALLVSGAALGAFAFVPGLPTLPFLLLSVGAGVAGFLSRNQNERQVREEQEEAARAAEEAEAPAEERDGDDIFVVDRLELEIGYGLIPIVDAGRGGDLLQRITNVRRKTGSELGINVAPIRIRDNLQLGANEYVVKLRGVEITRFELHLDRLLAMRVRDGGADVPGITTSEPAFGLPAVWISKDDKSQAEMAGYTVVEPSAVVATHLAEIVKAHADEILTRQDVKDMVDRLGEHAPALVEEVFGDKISLTVLHGVLRGLLHERIPVRDLVTILETLASSGPVNEGTRSTRLVERVRMAAEPAALAPLRRREPHHLGPHGPSRDRTGDLLVVPRVGARAERGHGSRFRRALRGHSGPAGRPGGRRWSLTAAGGEQSHSFFHATPDRGVVPDGRRPRIHRDRARLSDPIPGDGDRSWQCQPRRPTGPGRSHGRRGLTFRRVWCAPTTWRRHWRVCV